LYANAVHQGVTGGTTSCIATALSANSCQLTQNGQPIASAFPVSVPGLAAATTNDVVVNVGAGPYR